MLASATRFPAVGSFVLITLPLTGPRGGHVGSVRRKARIQQHCADGTFLVTAAPAFARIGNRMVCVAAIHRRATRDELSEAPDRAPDADPVEPAPTGPAPTDRPQREAVPA